MKWSVLNTPRVFWNTPKENKITPKEIKNTIGACSNQPISPTLGAYFPIFQPQKREKIWFWARFRAENAKICYFAATLLPPIFPLNRAFNAIWWQDGSKIKKNKISSLFSWKRWVRLRNAYWEIRNAYWEITQGYDKTPLGLNSCSLSEGFGLSVRAERTGSPCGRTKPIYLPL